MYSIIYVSSTLLLQQNLIKLCLGSFYSIPVILISVLEAHAHTENHCSMYKH